MRKKLVVLTGAGISKESSINTFRDSVEGLWENFDIKVVAHVDALNHSFDKVLDFYNERRKKLDTVKPNKAHLILKELEDYLDVYIITQNVDDLHERVGSKNVLHLHGELRKKRPMDNNNIVDYVEDIYEGDLDSRGVQYRPHIVMFGEQVPMINTAVKIVRNCDYFLIVGTSLEVYPANSLDFHVDKKALQYYIDPEKNDNIFNVKHIQKVATEGMEEFKNIIIKDLEIQK